MIKKTFHRIVFFFYFFQKIACDVDEQKIKIEECDVDTISFSIEMELLIFASGQYRSPNYLKTKMKIELKCDRERIDMNTCVSRTDKYNVMILIGRYVKRDLLSTFLYCHE